MPTGASKEIDKIIAGLPDWRGPAFARLRKLIREADPGIHEDVKWKKPSNPSGTPCWYHDGLIVVGNAFKNKVTLTFDQGASIPDPKKLFNSNLNGSKWRGIDVFEGGKIDEPGFKAIMRAAVKLNTFPAAHG